MANTLTIQDAYALINGIAAQALGSSAIQAVDATTYVTVGEAILRTGLESTLNALTYTFGRTIFSIRPYRAKLSSMEREEERFGMITRKITYLTGEAEESQDWNTDVNPAQLDDGESVDHYKIRKPKAVQLNFPGAQALQNHITRFRDQIAPALRDPAEMIRFWEGAMVQFYNDIERQREARTRAVLLNRIAGQVVMGVGVVDLGYEYNAEHGTSYTRQELLTTYETDFWKFAMARVKKDSDAMTDYSTMYHANLDGYQPIGRHTPKERQRMIMYNPAFIDAETNVYSTIFRPEYLQIGGFEGVNYWQSKNNPPTVICKPNYLDVSDGESKSAGDAVTIPYVLGILYDEEAMGVQPKFDYSIATPMNAAGNYWNLYVHWLFRMYNDFTENSIVYVIGDAGETSVEISFARRYLYQGSALKVGGSIWTPSLQSGTYEYSCEVNAQYDGARLYFTRTQPYSIVSLSLNDVEYNEGDLIPLAVGDNAVTVTVTSPGYLSTEYTFTLTRAEASKDADDVKTADEEEPAETKSTKSKK